MKPVSYLTNVRDNIKVNYREMKRDICDRMH